MFTTVGSGKIKENNLKVHQKGNGWLSYRNIEKLKSRMSASSVSVSQESCSWYIVIVFFLRCRVWSIVRSNFYFTIGGGRSHISLGIELNSSEFDSVQFKLQLNICVGNVPLSIKPKCFISATRLWYCGYLAIFVKGTCNKPEVFK